jgi:hypothetical protein
MKQNAIIFLTHMACKVWLEKQQPRYLLYPAQKSCIREALKFLPLLVSKVAPGLAPRPEEEEPMPEMLEPPPTPDFD